MYSVTQLGQRLARRITLLYFPARQFCDYSFCNDTACGGVKSFEELLKESSDFDPIVDGLCGLDDDENHIRGNFPPRRSFFKNTQRDADRIFEVLRQDDLSFDVKLALNELNIRVSGLLVREVLLKILRLINYRNRSWCARLGYRFFIWSHGQDKYKHTVNTYQLMMRIFADCGQFKAMGRLFSEMIEQGYPVTARTFNILICNSGEAGMERKDIERFIKLKTFNFRQHKHSYNAILHSLLAIKQYKLIEWVYQRMLAEDCLPDILTYNILMWTKYRLGKICEFLKLFDDMLKNGFTPDFHTYSILLHFVGEENKPDEAVILLNKMKEVGLYPSVLHYSTLIDGLSRARNLDACEYFFDEMIKNGQNPDVVCYTVMITGYVVVMELEKAQQLFNEMIAKGQLPNVFTYNSMIRGLCGAGKYEEACSILKEMESRGCNPNFHVYRTLVRNLQNAEKFSEAEKVIRDMQEKGRYAHLCAKFNRHRYRRC